MRNTSANIPPFSQIAVVGGTPFDSAKGAIYLKGHGIDSTPIGISEKPSVQAELYKKPELVVEKFDEKVGERDFSDIIIYCNSLSFVGHWRELYPGRIFELTSYYKEILHKADQEKLAIIVAEQNTRNNLLKMVEREEICDPQQLHIFPDLKLINTLERSDESEQFEILKKTLNQYKEQGFREILLGCTHLDHPEFNKVRDLKIYQPGLIMLDEFIEEFKTARTRLS